MERLALSVKEAAEAIGIGVSLMHKLVRSGDIPSIKFGEYDNGRRVIPVSALTRWMDEHVGETI